MHIQVEFEPFGRTVQVTPGMTVAEASARAGLTLESPCGGLGKCCKCRVRIVSGVLPPNPPDRRSFSEAELDEGWRLACQTPLFEDARVFLPDISLFGGMHQIFAASAIDGQTDVLPSIRKAFVTLEEPSLADDTPDFERLQAALAEQGIACRETPLHILRALPHLLREYHFSGTAVVLDGCLIDFERADTGGVCHGVAVDVGTTTLAAALVDLVTGRELAIVSRMNPQTMYGDDVLARIVYASRDNESLLTMQRALLDEIEDMISVLCQHAGILRHTIYEAAFAGNTAMQHLLCGINPVNLGVLPFISAFGAGLRRSAAEFPLNIHPKGKAYIFPAIGGFVGGDTVAGLLTTRLIEAPGPVLFLDLGTNGEIVLQHQGQLYAASTAAGPAFEGARITCGMRGARGAIERVSIEEDLKIGVIGGGMPAGLCGSGLVDIVAELLDWGLLTPQGRLLTREELPETTPEPLRARTTSEADGEPAFTLFAGGQGTRAIHLTQKDVRELQLAAGAIRAGIAILLKQQGLTAEDLLCVYVAGGFGAYLQKENALRIGLFPPGVYPDRIRYVGNTALCGAKWAVLSTEAREQANLLAFEARHCDLSSDPDFALEFAMAMQFPEE